MSVDGRPPDAAGFTGPVPSTGGLRAGHGADSYQGICRDETRDLDEGTLLELDAARPLDSRFRGNDGRGLKTENALLGSGAGGRLVGPVLQSVAASRQANTQAEHTAMSEVMGWRPYGRR